MKVIVIGGVAAGMSAASKIRRNAYASQVTVYEKGHDLSYGACGLPYYIGDEIKDPNLMVARTKEAFEKMGIDVHIGHEVVSVNEEEKEVKIKNLMTGESFSDFYDELIVASGAHAIRPPWPGIDLENVVTLSTLEDGKHIKNIIKKDTVRSVAIIGAGFIGVELAEAALNYDKTVYLIEYKNQILPHLDKEIVYPLQEELERQGVHVKTGEKVLELLGEGRVKSVLTDKNCFDADLVIVSVGVKPSTDFLKDTSVKRLVSGAVIVDKQMRSSVAHIYAAGDCATIYNRVTDDLEDYIPLGTNANKQGRLLGEILTGSSARFSGVLGTSMIKVCQMEGAKTGLSERQAIHGNYDYIKSMVSANNHASYYPNPKPMTIKLIADRQTRKLLGAQIVGGPDAAIRIDIFALAIHTGIRVDELAWVDFGYAPPFAGVWDAVHIAANAVK